MYSFNKGKEVKFSQIIIGHLFFYNSNYYVKLNNTEANELISDRDDKKVITFTKKQQDSTVKTVEIKPS